MPRAEVVEMDDRDGQREDPPDAGADEPTEGRNTGTPVRLPPDPGRYDEERNVLARARGLSAPYIAGGEDADPEGTRRTERLYGRLLLLMILAIVGTSLVLTIIAIALGYAGFGSG
jgi:hypothetical protein